MPGPSPRIPLGLQVGAVLVLFAASLASLWSTGTAIVEQERRRSASRGELDTACGALVDRGREILDPVRRFPDFAYMDPGDWEAIERGLADEAGRVLAAYPGVQGGYFNQRGPRFLPDFPDRPTRAGAGSRPESDLYDYVETQADAAIRKRRVMAVVGDVPPGTVAVVASPIAVGDRVFSAAWAMTRLDDPVSLQGYRLSAVLALGGIALALTLTVGLARTVRRQAAERDRLQGELRRSERLAAMGKLLAGVAHEVRNPLAGIRSTIQLWQRGIGPDDESFDGLTAEVDRLEGIVSRLLQFSRADTQDLAPGDLNAVVAEAARLARGQAEAQGVVIDLDLDPDLPPVALSASALLQVFRNLTTNALQVMPDGGTLSLATRRDPDGRRVEVVVSDTGPGLSPEAQRHLFEPFFTTKAEGTGLGLAIAREIALAHRGEIRVGNRPDGRAGAVFTLVLPAERRPVKVGVGPS